MKNPPISTAVQITGKSTITRLRAATRSSGKRDLWLSTLTDQHLAEVYHRLLRGQEVQTIAKIAQKEWGQLVNSKLVVLCNDIRTFRTRVIGKLLPQAHDDKDKKLIKHELFEKAAKIASKVDGMELLAWTISEQAQRVQMWRDRENLEHEPIKAAETTISELGKLLEKYINLQINLGVLDSKPSEFNLHLKHSFDGVLNNVIKGNTGTIVDVANKFAKLAEESALNLEQNEDGTWQMIEDKTKDKK